MELLVASIEELRHLVAKLTLTDGWPTTIDGLDLVKKVAGMLIQGGDVCRSHRGIAKQITCRHRLHGRLVTPQTKDVKWALAVLRASKDSKERYKLPPGSPWEPHLPDKRRHAPQPKQTSLRFTDEW